MGIISNTVCWKLLGSASEHDSPAQLVEFVDSIERVASKIGLELRADRLHALAIQDQIAEMIGRSLQPRASTLPSVAHSITMEGECWHLVLHLTQIPHLSAAIVPTGSSRFNNYRFPLIQELIRLKNADFGEAEDKQLHGDTWALYFFFKIKMLKPLRDAFSMRPYIREPILKTPNLVFPQLNGIVAPMSKINAQDARQIQDFLDKCDRLFVEQVGKSSLEEYLGASGISAKQFLRCGSQK